MSRKILSFWLKLIVVLFALCGFFVYGFLIPTLANETVSGAPEFAFAYWPWLIILLGTAVPCYLSLICLWKLAGNMAKDQSFKRENARLLKWIAILAVFDSVYFFVGNIIMGMLNAHHFTLLALALVTTIIGIAISAFAASLSYLFTKAADLQDQIDLTI